MLINIKIRYILLGFLIGFFTPTISVGSIFPHKKNQTDSCFSNYEKDYRSLRKATNKIDRNYSDNYLYVLFLHNYNFNLDKNKKQLEFLYSMLYKANKAIEENCSNIENISMLKGIVLLYQKNYSEAYKIFDNYSGMNANLWLAHTAIYMGELDTAKNILQEIEAELDTANKELKKRYKMIVSDFFIKTQDYENALAHLLEIEKMSLPRYLKIRTELIIGQIYSQLGNHKQASIYYEKVGKYFFGVKKLMKSYSIVNKHLCEQLQIEEEEYLLALANKEPEEIPEFEPTVVENYIDTSFFNTTYPYYFNDAAAMFFLDEAIENELDDIDADSIYDRDDYYEIHYTNEMLEGIFENWESFSIHIPKTDFSSMTDTVYLQLVRPNSGYTLPRFNQVISKFGWRRYRYHYGVDTKNTLGDSIFCAFDGVVRIAKRNKTYGNVIIIRHYNELETFYAHCSKLLVEPNQEVKAGELIAFVGNTGRSKGVHLHFETRYKGAAFNPEYIIDFEKGELISETLMITKETFNYLRSGNSSSVATKTSTSAPSVNSGYYTIRPGDTLSSIAKKYKTTVERIKKLNSLKSDFIKEGQRIRVL